MSPRSESYIFPSSSQSQTESQPRPRSYTTSTTSSLDSLPSETTSASDLSSDYSDSDAEAEWQESIEQLELLLTMVLVPFVGKYLGRRCAYWSWTRFMEWKYPIEGKEKIGPVGGSVRAFAAL
ncbi:hypothetical protein BJX99DRAFT_217188 [Aspergillus californicus]